MLKPPSLQKQWDEFWSGDPAFQPRPGKGASDKDKEAYLKKLEVARDTGNWSEFAIEGLNPTKFTMKQVPGTLLRKLVDRFTTGAIGPAELASLLFRAAIIEIENLGFDHKIKRVQVADYGALADQETVDMLDAIDVDIVTELGIVIRQRAEGASPK